MCKNRKKLSVAIMTIFIILSLFPYALSNALTVQTGAGSYIDTLPAGKIGPTSTVYKTANLSGGIGTNSWESSVLWTQYSQPLFAHPLTYRCTAAGLEVGKPNGGGSGIAYFWSHKVDFTVENSSVSTVRDAKMDKITDWGADILMAGGAGSMKATLLKGSPFAYFYFAGGNPVLSFKGTPVVFYGNSNSQYLGVTINGINYGLFAPTGSTWSGIGTATITCNLKPGSDYFSIALLTSQNDLGFFKDYAYAFITDTKVSWAYDENSSTLTTTFSAVTTPKEGTNKDTVFALYPHQWRNNSLIKALPYTYTSIRGRMKTVSGTSFSTQYKYQGVLPNLPDKGTYDSNMLNTYINQVYNEPNHFSATDTYWLGKQLGRISQVLPIAEQVGNTAAVNNFISTMKSTLQNWFTASDGETTGLFYYDKNWGTLIGYDSSYGSNDILNDHHFHYGYFIQATAQIALRDPEWGSDAKWGGMVKELIKDINNWDRTDTRYPFLRYFDPYEGHSWASGNVMFADGNNQESSSEAMNANYSIILFGEATGNKTIRDLGIYLYTTEKEAINEYWFNLNGDIFDPAYSHIYASMVWGAKYTHENWWGGSVYETHGINYLPITAGHTYLATDPAYVKKNWDEMMKEGAGVNMVWPDIQYEYYALYDPDSAAAMWNASITPEDGETKAHTYHWINTLNGIGTPDFSITANTPLYGVFNKNGLKTYAAYNASSTSKTVTFSDGKTLYVPAKSMAASNGNGGQTPVPYPSATPSPTIAPTISATPVPTPTASDNNNDFKVETVFNPTVLSANRMMTAQVTVTNITPLNYSGVKDVLLIVSLYDKNNTLANVSYISKGIPYRGTETLSAGFKLPSDITGYSVKAFVWDGTDLKTTNMIPLSNVSQIVNSAF